jgi:hypothetical protein
MTGAAGTDDYPLHLDVVNAMSEDEFVAAFGDIAEHSPWVAANASEARPFRTRTAMIAAFREAVAGADHKRQKALLLAHPDLAARVREDSSQQVQSVGSVDPVHLQDHFRVGEDDEKDQVGQTFPVSSRVAVPDGHRARVLLGSAAEAVGETKVQPARVEDANGAAQRAVGASVASGVGRSPAIPEAETTGGALSAPRG